MNEQEMNQLKFYRTFYINMWGSDWISSDVLYDITKASEAESGFDAEGEESEGINYTLKDQGGM